MRFPRGVRSMAIKPGVKGGRVNSSDRSGAIQLTVALGLSSLPLCSRAAGLLGNGDCGQRQDGGRVVADAWRGAIHCQHYVDCLADWPWF